MSSKAATSAFYKQRVDFLRRSLKFTLLHMETAAVRKAEVDKELEASRVEFDKALDELVQLALINSRG